MTIWYANADTGNDTTGNGTSALPYLTYSKCVSVSASGDTIYLQNATAVYTPVSTNIGVGSTLIVIGQSNTGVTMAFTTAGLKSFYYTISFSYIKFTTNDTYHSYGRFTGEGGSVLSFTNCVFTHSAACTHTIWFGAYQYQSTFTVQNCLFYAMTGIYNAILQGSTSAVNFPTYYFYNNTFYNINHFVFYTQANYMITAKNNIFHTTSTFDERGNWVANGCIAQYNDFYTVTSAPSGTGNITSNPLFVDLGNLNFNLRPTSLCIDTGTIV